MENREALAPRRDPLAVGQVVEWLVWVRLVSGSAGDLHVFLPLEDRGIDGIVHRISTDTYMPVQVKGLTCRRPDTIELSVLSDELADDRSMLIAVAIGPGNGAVSDQALAIPAPVFKEMSHLYHHADGQLLYEGRVRLLRPAGTRWEPWCVPASALAERVLPPRADASTPDATPMAPPWGHRPGAARRMGHRAEMELLRRSADCDALNIFKAAPDLEPNEYLAYNLESRDVLGIQVKSVRMMPGRREGTLNVYLPALRPSSSTWFVIFLADPDAGDFLPDCAVVPSDVLAAMLLPTRERLGEVSVSRGLAGRFARWRVPLTSLGARLGEYRAVVA